MRNVLLTGALALSAHVSFAQPKSFKFEDGTVINVDIRNTNPDEGRKASVFVGGFGPEELHFVGATYYKPSRFYVEALWGTSSFDVDGNIFFFSKLKKARFRQSVRTSGNTRYVLRVPGEKRKMLGLHTGAGQTEFFKTETSRGLFSATTVVAGLTWMGAKHTNWYIESDNKTVQGTALCRLNADVVFYLNRQMVGGKGSVDSVSRDMGYRLYYDGGTTVWSKSGRFTIHYMFGVGLPADKLVKWNLIAGLGLGYSFL